MFTFLCFVLFWIYAYCTQGFLLAPYPRQLLVVLRRPGLSCARHCTISPAQYISSTPDVYFLDIFSFCLYFLLLLTIKKKSRNFYEDRFFQINMLAYPYIERMKKLK